MAQRNRKQENKALDKKEADKKIAAEDVQELPVIEGPKYGEITFNNDQFNQVLNLLKEAIDTFVEAKKSTSLYKIHDEQYKELTRLAGGGATKLFDLLEKITTPPPIPAPVVTDVDVTRKRRGLPSRKKAKASQSKLDGDLNRIIQNNP